MMQYTLAILKKKDRIIFTIISNGQGYLSHEFAEADIWNGNFSRSLKTTEEILSLARNRASNIPIYMFSADSRLGKYEELIARNNNITYIKGLDEDLNFHAENKANLFILNDAHWNYAGNKVVGLFLVKYFKDASIFA